MAGRRKCRVCGCRLRDVPITKYNNFKVFGTNLFCPNPKCGYEADVAFVKDKEEFKDYGEDGI